MLLYKLVIINVQLIGQLYMMELRGHVVLDQLFMLKMVEMVQTISLVPVLKMRD